MNFPLPKIAIALALWCASLTVSFAASWSFGIIADTQWSGPDDGKNPNSVAADILRQIDQELIAKGVRLVLAVGDTVDKSNKTSLATRARYAQDLYNAGIAFYPLRGNHDAAWPESGREFARLYPQIGTGINNNTPPDCFAADLIPAPDLAANPPAAKKGAAFPLGDNFSAPETNATFQSLSYSFDHENVRFVLLDPFDATARNSTIAAQQDWISGRLCDPKRPLHAFVFGHKGLLNGSHKDNLFGNHTGNDPGDADPAQQPEQNAFIASLAQNGVHYYISGHDHHHSESIVTSPDGCNSVRQIICASDSNKFYVPRPPFSDHQKSVSLDCKKIGFYICTVDGPSVTIDYWGVDVSAQLDNSRTLTTTPQLTGHWKKLFTSGYRLGEANKAMP
ncbi:MAG: metallophosphoesterase [Verrucomicrobia bacterium]|nr:metallophosphoesterase [Verrucomicrobiota bacterium]